MKMISLAVGVLAAVAATPVLAQSVDLTGTYKCVQMCRIGLVGNPAFVTQNGPQRSRSGVPRLAGLVRTGDPDLDREL